MTLLSTKPTWHKGEIIATERGWVNPQNNEVLVAIGNLKLKLEAEGVLTPEPVAKTAPVAKAEKDVFDIEEAMKQDLGAVVVTENLTTLSSTPAPVNEVVLNIGGEDQTVIAEVVEVNVVAKPAPLSKKAKKEAAAMEKKQIIAEVVEDIAGTDDKKVIIAEVVEVSSKPVITE